MAAKKQQAKKPGRPRLQISEKQVYSLASLGCTNVEIATVLGCSDDTLVNNYSEPLKKGRENLKKSLRKFQFDSAKKGSVAMQIWLGKQYLGQRDKQEIETVSLTERERIDRLIAAQMEDFGISREEAIKDLSLTIPRIREYVN